MKFDFHFVVLFLISNKLKVGWEMLLSFSCHAEIMRMRILNTDQKIFDFQTGGHVSKLSLKWFCSNFKLNFYSCPLVKIFYMAMLAVIEVRRF